MHDRRQLLTLGLGALGAAALSPSLTRLAMATLPTDRYFVFAYFPGAWDVLMSLDPKAPGIASDYQAIDRSLDRDEVDATELLADYTGAAFEPVAFAGDQVTSCLQPLLDQLGDHGQHRSLSDVGMCVVRGMTMDTLTHQVGRRRFITGQPPSGQNARGSSVATVLSALLRQGEPIPNLVVNTESYNVDQPAWATGLSVANVDDLLRAVQPGEMAVAPEERERVQSMLASFADCTVAQRSKQAGTALDSRSGAFELVGGGLGAQLDLFSGAAEMIELRERFRITGNNGNTVEARAALAALALSSGASRIVSYGASDNLDTHFDNWADDQFANQYRGYRALAALVDHLGSTLAPGGGTLLERTTILAFSDFARTPVINGNGGRDHWLMNSCLLLGKGVHHGVVGQSSDDGMAPVARDVAGVSTYVKPEHIHQALLHDLGFPEDTIDLRVPADTAVLSG